MSEYCVYRHVRLDKNTPFYVGKGKGGRYKSTLRNKYWHRIVNKYNYKIEIIKDNLSEKEVFDLEQKIIKLYKNFNYCEANLCDGGRGIKGYKHTPEVIEKLKKIASGKNNPFYGKKHTKKVREKMAKKATGRKACNRKAVYCKNNKKTYDSITEAAKELGLSTSFICRVLKGKLKHAKGYVFEYIGDRLCQE